MDVLKDTYLDGFDMGKNPYDKKIAKSILSEIDFDAFEMRKSPPKLSSMDLLIEKID